MGLLEPIEVEKVRVITPKRERVIMLKSYFKNKALTNNNKQTKQESNLNYEQDYSR